MGGGVEDIQIYKKLKTTIESRKKTSEKINNNVKNNPDNERERIWDSADDTSKENESKIK